MSMDAVNGGGGEKKGVPEMHHQVFQYNLLSEVARGKHRAFVVGQG